MTVNQDEKSEHQILEEIRELARKIENASPARGAVLSLKLERLVEELEEKRGK